MREYLVTILFLLATAVAGEVTVTTPLTRPLAQKPVAVVNGDPITLGDLELALLRQEGADLIEKVVRDEMDNKEWENLADDKPVLARIPNRGRLALELLVTNGLEVRGQLINIRLVEQALASEGIVIDAQTEEAELKRMQKRLDASMEKRKDVHTDLRTVIQSKYGMSLERWRQQKGFRMMVGIHALMDRRAAKDISDEEVNDWLTTHRDRYSIQAAADLSVFFFPYDIPKGQTAATAEERQNKLQLMRNLHALVRKEGRVAFERAWAMLGGRIHDPDGVPGGRIGWVRQDGRREKGNGRVIAADIMRQALAAPEPYPTVVEPVATEAGVELAMVHGRREAKEPTRTELTDQIRRDIVDEELDQRQQQLMEVLRSHANIEYPDKLNDLVAARARELGVDQALLRRVMQMAGAKP
jgi:hypothetical protein